MGNIEFKIGNNAKLFVINLHNSIEKELNTITKIDFPTIANIFKRFKSFCHGFEYKYISKESLQVILQSNKTATQCIFNKFDVNLKGKIDFYQLFVSIVATANITSNSKFASITINSSHTYHREAI